MCAIEYMSYLGKQFFIYLQNSKVHYSFLIFTAALKNKYQKLLVYQLCPLKVHNILLLGYKTIEPYHTLKTIPYKTISYIET
jgi:hypothetical protein